MDGKNHTSRPLAHLNGHKAGEEPKAVIKTD